MSDVVSPRTSGSSQSTGSPTSSRSGVEALRRLLAIENSVRRASESATKWWAGLRSRADTAVTRVALDELLAEVLAAIRDLLHADGVAVLVADERGDELVARGSVGLGDVTGEVHIPAGTGMAGRVLASRHPMVVPDLSAIPGVSDALLGSGVRSLVAVPILASDGSALGVLHADSFQLDRFGDDDAEVLGLLADRLAMAMERVRLFEAEREARDRAEVLAQRLGRLQRITAALSRDLDAAGLAEVILTEVASDLGEGVVSRTLWLIEGSVLRRSAMGGSEGGSGAFTEISLDAALPGPVAIRTGKNLWIEDRAELESRFPLLKESYGVARALCVLPLVVLGEPRGVLALGFDREQPFDDDQRSFLSVVGFETAQALHRQWLHEVQATSALRALFLADVSAALAASLDAPRTLANTVHLMVPEVADIASLHLFDEIGVLRRAAFAHRDPQMEQAAEDYADEHGYEARSVMLTATASAGRAVLLPATGEDIAAEIALDEGHANILNDLGIRSAIAVPLVVRGETLGLLGLMRLQGSEPYGADDLHFADELGRRAAVSIDNALTHQRRTEVAQALQASLLPPALIEVPGVEVAATFKPAGEGVKVGGDFYDAFPLDDGRWVFMIGDVSGSGPAAAALTAQVRHGARVAARAGLGPPEVISLVNASLDETTGSEWFCTMVYVQLQVHADGADAQIICAGHPPPLVLREGEVEELSHHGPLLGVLPNASYRDRVVRLGPGQALILVTDGAIEARSRCGEADPRPQFFGTERLTAAIQKAAGQPAHDIVQSIVNDVLEFVGGHLSDDMAVLVIRVDPRPPS